MDDNQILHGYTEYLSNNHSYPGMIYYTESTTSTMDDARTFASRGAVPGTIVCTGFQSRGRGRFRDRKWHSPPGENLLFTLLLKKESFPFPHGILPVLTGLALAFFCENNFGFSPSIKWPNDVLYHKKKIAGILCEGDNTFLYCGIGINCSQRGFDNEIADSAISFTQITRKKVLPMELIEPFCSFLWDFFSSPWHREETWYEEVTKRLYRLGDTIRVIKEVRTGAVPPCHMDNIHGNTGSIREDVRNRKEEKKDVIVEGVLSGIDRDGALLVLEHGKIQPQRVISGQVVFIQGIDKGYQYNK
jgi:biotin-[acetyl-CoA-carboxylase] ligase BirA-like protein